MFKWLKWGRNLPSIPLNPQPGDMLVVMVATPEGKLKIADVKEIPSKEGEQ